jgi:hypothetical protein
MLTGLDPITIGSRFVAWLLTTMTPLGAPTVGGVGIALESVSQGTWLLEDIVRKGGEAPEGEKKRALIEEDINTRDGLEEEKEKSGCCESFGNHFDGIDRT